MILKPKTKKYLIQISLITLIIFLFSTTFTILYLRYNQPSPNLITIRKNNPESSVSTFIPNQQLNAQKKFLDTINYQLKNLPQSDTYEYILLRAYGAIFINQNPEIKLPPKVIVDNEQDTKQIQDNLQLTLVEGTQECYLQKAAADAFDQARNIIDIPLKSGYSGDCTRSFATNLRFWQKYTNNQTLEQVKQGKETNILSVVAPPGTSQHLWGLALDLRVSNQEQREALNQNGWFQTVAKDVPHWTYLGWDEESLPKFGLQEKIISGITYWLTPI
ncbi:peptidase M15B and M15C, D,D-carboxypeptidase VanY/endolysin [Sphaerospermopsis reniformis]|uniref:Peptidase M15B and M15C, D,D-carboxypeptidase VanY/endolysin n=1 Tax=Sphaerospermopsis reniformis TaxID=531300 RepID=A0A479ZXY7_9CYAN|nr:D-alanyl-D-alanine carboxypeptidase family protein [Sphaerospermopsis reniformis]GCL37082.1 peptidase M15B and M15C, D,D-carboxypeptidase VanY/endolysin [Sphaerospermopsis reniformis]